MPRRSRSSSPPELKKSQKPHKHVSASRSSSPSSSSSSSSRSRSRTRGKRRRSISNGKKVPPVVKTEPKRGKEKESDTVKKEKKVRDSRSRSPKREERAKSKDRGKEKNRNKPPKGRERSSKEREHDTRGNNRSRERDRKKEVSSSSSSGSSKDIHKDERGVKRESGNKHERKQNTDSSPLTLGGRRWEDDSVKKEQGSWGGDKEKDRPSSKPAVEKQKPDFAPSGALEEERNTVNGINLNYAEPPDARPPDAKWRLYVFKGEKQLDPLFIHRQSAYIVGRERKVAHIPIDHPSCSKQHSVIQFRIKRITPATADDEAVTAIRPYIIDLNSTNGTFLNGKKIDPAKYYELLEEDILKFGHSTREYVVIKAETQAGPTTLD